VTPHPNPKTPQGTGLGSPWRGFWFENVSWGFGGRKSKGKRHSTICIVVILPPSNLRGSRPNQRTPKNIGVFHGPDFKT